MENNNYLAITLGPIYKTLSQVRKTRELWATSYFFSKLSQKLIEGILAKEEQALLSPFYEKENPIGIGLYSDRIFCKGSDKLNLASLEEIKSKAIKDLATEFLFDNADFLNRYIVVSMIEYPACDINAIRRGNLLLDSADLQNSWETNESANELLAFFRDVNIKKKNNINWIANHIATTDAYGGKRFESMAEIATRAIRDLKDQDYKEFVKKYCFDQNEEQEDLFISDLKRTLNNTEESRKNGVFKNYHKYVCIIKADGDKVGKYINAIPNGNDVLIKKLSESLHQWGKMAQEKITNYMGIPLYIGGDDVLALAPVVGKTGNIIDLVTQIASDFKTQFHALDTLLDDDKNEIKPTLSFGVSITYYKFPLYESLKKAESLLYNAKEIGDALSISILKHAGSPFDFRLSINKEDTVNKLFVPLSKDFVDKENFTSSIIHHFRDHEKAYQTFLSLVDPSPSNRFVNYLKYHFDSQENESVVEKVAKLAYFFYSNATEVNATHSIYSAMRILKFLNGHDDAK